MSDNTTSAVSSITPSATGRAPRAAKSASVSAAPTGKKGRPALMLKGGVPYKEAAAAAKQVLFDAKAGLKTASAELKLRNKGLEADVKLYNKATGAIAATEAAGNKAMAKAPTDKAVKQTAKENLAKAKQALKDAGTNVKASTKDVKAQQALVAKAEIAVTKAQAGVDKVEAAKAAAVN